MIFINALRFKYECLKSDWALKTPKQKWDLLYNVGKFPSKIMGLRTYIGLDVNWHSSLCGVVILTCNFLVFYTIVDNFRQNEYIKIVENCGSLGILASVSITIFLNSKIYRKVIEND